MTVQPVPTTEPFYMQPAIASASQPPSSGLTVQPVPTTEPFYMQPAIASASQPPSSGLTVQPVPTTESSYTQPAIGLASQAANTGSAAIHTRVTARQLPSSAIDVTTLKPCNEIIRKFPKLHAIHKAPTLAVKLARLSFFGDNVLAQCTVMGCREYPGLPREELHKLKQALSSQFIVYLRQPEEFEPVWASCIDAIGQACKRLRRNRV